jgi:hypothetical protein
MLDCVTHEHFANLAPEALDLTILDRHCHPQVIALQEFAAHPSRAHAPFALVLAAPQDWQFPQGVYSLRHPQLGTLELFMVPIGPCEQGMRYEIIFN